MEAVPGAALGVSGAAEGCKFFAVPHIAWPPESGFYAKKIDPPNVD